MSRASAAPGANGSLDKARLIDQLLAAWAVDRAGEAPNNRLINR